MICNQLLGAPIWTGERKERGACRAPICTDGGGDPSWLKPVLRTERYQSSIHSSHRRKMLRNQPFPVFLCCWSNLATGDAFKPPASSYSRFWNYIVLQWITPKKKQIRKYKKTQRSIKPVLEYPSSDVYCHEKVIFLWEHYRLKQFVLWCMGSNRDAANNPETGEQCSTSGHPGQEDNKSSFNPIHKSWHIRLNLTDETARNNIS